MPRRRPVVVASKNGAVALPAAMDVLRRGGSALDAVEAAARIVEADPADTSVGRGGWPNILGTVEVDASIMDGATRRAGSVGAVRGYLHPISIARAVMERLPHVMLVGDGAMRFADEIGAERARLLTARTRGLWVDFLRLVRETPRSVARRRELAPVVMRTVRLERKGTVNFIAIDAQGHMASAVSTSGWGYKYPGRLGDSPIIGAGNYCDERYGGACCTGFGELAMRALTAKTAVDRLAAGLSPEEVARCAIADVNELDAPRPAAMNVIVLAHDGRYASATNRRYTTLERKERRRFAVMTAEMPEPLVLDRTLVK
ncbi:MAG: N(4)-(beta-N-acetylglucosaminyl)-L-asparaginase [Chloroflexota bacterium]|nr:N(4)-(beta-N-acetylglucosaminyl)-L-asparaginase [Chloroflexota bacterium]MDE3101312.1 N(4)-(beta-N-acetylglucosaminyl)-L-asparaginase [Chloroflexota bacterium]